MKIKKLTFIFLCCFTIQTIAQPVRNYDSKGKVQKSTTDFLSVTGSDVTRVFPVAIIPVIVGAGINIYNTLKERKQASYTGVYSNTFSFEHLPKTIKLQRMMITDKKVVDYKYEKIDPIAATYDLEVLKDPGGIKIKLFAASLKRSKACFKPGHTLAITVNIKLTGTADDGSAIDLGEGNIIIPMIYVRDDVYDFEATNLDEYVTKANFLPLPIKSDLLPVSMTVSITEINLNKVSPTVVESILKSNGSDLIDVLKGALGVD